MLRFSVFFIAVLFFMRAASMPVSAAPAQSLQAGDAFPAFMLKDSQSVTKTHADMSGNAGWVAIVTRSVTWCPYCQKQMMDFQTALPAFTVLGYNVAGISYDPPEETAAFAARHKISFPLLSDHDSALIKALGILNEDHAPGTKFYGIPNPAIYIIDKDSKILRIFSEESYKARPEIADILQFLSGPKQ